MVQYINRKHNKHSSSILKHVLGLVCLTYPIKDMLSFVYSDLIKMYFFKKKKKE